MSKRQASLIAGGVCVLVFVLVGLLLAALYFAPRDTALVVLVFVVVVGLHYVYSSLYECIRSNLEASGQ